MFTAMTDSSPDPVAATLDAYRAAPAAYAQATEEMGGSAGFPLASSLASRVAPGGLVLDLGCGPGRDMEWFSGKGFRVLGVDGSPALVELARSRAVGDVLVGDLRRLPVDEDAVDAVWSMAAMLHLPKDEFHLALFEARRVLRSGGPFALSMKEGEGQGWEASPYPGMPARFFARYRLEELCERLTSSGFRVRESEGVGGWLNVLCD